MERLHTSTQILSVWGFYSHLPNLDPQRQQDIYDRGNLVGKACNWLAIGKEPPWKQPHPELEKRLDGYRQFIKEHQWKLQSWEDEFTDPELQYIAHTDQRGLLDGKSCILEIKTGSYNGPATEMQTAAQWLAAWSSGKGDHIRCCLHLPDSGRYKLKMHIDEKSVEDWSSLMRATNTALRLNLPLGRCLKQIMAEDRRYNS